MMANSGQLEQSLAQPSLFPITDIETRKTAATSSTFTDNMSLPVHRWFRYSAGFSALWVESVIQKSRLTGPMQIFDPFAGSGTTLLTAQNMGIESWGTEAHPFVYRIAQAKLAWNSDAEAYRHKIDSIYKRALKLKPSITGYPELILKCYEPSTLARLDVLRRALEAERDDSPAFDLAWLTLLTTLRKVSTAGTAQWQYILPNKPKKTPHSVERAMFEAAAMIYGDMQIQQQRSAAPVHLLLGDARNCEGIASGSVNLVITSPPYPNNYDYADATRLEMSFMQEITGWGDLQEKVRRFLMRSCSQHTPEKNHILADILGEPSLEVVRNEMEDVCARLAEIKETKGGKKNYHLMIAAYFRDISLVWLALRRVCVSPSEVCFVIGDSAPYGIYVPVIHWMEKIALASGFTRCSFEKTRDRNIKWKNRKHRVPLQEGRFWAKG
jgi:hypothetical protein